MGTSAAAALPVLLLLTLAALCGTATAAGTVELPEGWEEFFDENHQLPYYHHAESGTTTWTSPLDDAENQDQDQDQDAGDSAVLGGDGTSDEDEVWQDSELDEEWGDGSEGGIPAEISARQRRHTSQNNEDEYEDDYDYDDYERQQHQRRKKRRTSTKKNKKKKRRKKRCLSHSCLAGTLPELDDVYVSHLMGSTDIDCGKSDNPCKTIQAGIDRVRTDGNVHVFEGHYFGKGNVELFVGRKHLTVKAAMPHLKPLIDCQITNPLLSTKAATGTVRFHEFIIHDCDLRDAAGQKVPIGDVDEADVVSAAPGAFPGREFAGGQPGWDPPPRQPTLLERWFRL